MNKKVIEIPAKASKDLYQDKKIRVAAYCRVSTDMQEQQSSFEIQIKYYTDKIESNPQWELVDIFADEGISGISVKKRPEFMRMVKMSQRGKIDLILTKSISRFSRNTVDCLSWVRQLKSCGVSVIFEKEGINTAETIGETFLTWFSAFAQAESESISQNITWGKRKAFKEGRCGFPYHNFCGYERGDNNLPVIVEKEAIIIQRIYYSYLEGMSLRQIKEWLDAEKIPTPSGKQNWHPNTIYGILKNEKYCGDVLCQKTYTANFLTNDVRKNRGELPQYLIEDNHPAIISKEMFLEVQEEMRRRASIHKPKGKVGKYSSQYALTGKVFCEECGSPYRRTTWTNKRGQKKIVWRCVNRLEHGTQYCNHSPSIPEDDLKDKVLGAIKGKIAGIDIGQQLRDCFEQLGQEIPRALDEQLMDCFEYLVRFAMEKVIISELEITISFV